MLLIKNLEIPSVKVESRVIVVRDRYNSIKILARILSRTLPVEFSRTSRPQFLNPPGNSAIRTADPFVNLLYYAGEAVSSIAFPDKRLGSL